MDDKEKGKQVTMMLVVGNLVKNMDEISASVKTLSDSLGHLIQAVKSLAEQNDNINQRLAELEMTITPTFKV